MKALVMGGTGFLGGAITQAALRSGMTVDVLTRQVRESNEPNLRYVQGERYEPLAIDADYEFIFDTCAFEPEAFDQVLKVIDKQYLKKYVFISSASVYGDYSTPNITESAPVIDATTKDFELIASIPANERTSAMRFAESYGPLKRACEKALEAQLGGKAVSLRAGILVGAGDYTDRLTWWVRRIDNAGQVALPLPKHHPIQMIHVKDAAEFSVTLAQGSGTGVYNLTGHSMPFELLANTINNLAGNNAEFVWVALNKFFEQDLSPWTDIPLFLPEANEYKYFFDVQIQKAVDAGLTLMPVEDIVRDVLAWDRTEQDRVLKCGYSKELEQSLLKQ